MFPAKFNLILQIPDSQGFFPERCQMARVIDWKFPKSHVFLLKLPEIQLVFKNFWQLQFVTNKSVGQRFFPEKCWIARVLLLSFPDSYVPHFSEKFPIWYFLKKSRVFLLKIRMVMSWLKITRNSPFSKNFWETQLLP